MYHKYKFNKLLKQVDLDELDIIEQCIDEQQDMSKELLVGHCLSSFERYVKNVGDGTTRWEVWDTAFGDACMSGACIGPLVFPTYENGDCVN